MGMYEYELYELIEKANKAMIKRGLWIGGLLILSVVTYGATQSNIADAAVYYMAGYKNVTYDDYSKITIGCIIYAIYHAYKFLRIWLVRINTKKLLKDI